MHNTDLNKIWQLIYTTDLENIKLALQLAKSKTIDLNLDCYKEFYEWLMYCEIPCHLSTSKNSTIEEKLQYIFSMIELDIGEMEIEELPVQIESLKQLEHLTIRRNRMKLFPKLIFSLTGLKSLSISNNLIVEIPEEIKQLKNLRYLSLQNNSLDFFPESTLELLKLEVLNLTGNEISSIPVSINKLNLLEGLYLSQNSIHEIPKSLSGLKNLKKISLDYYKIPKEQLLKLKKQLPGISF